MRFNPLKRAAKTPPAIRPISLALQGGGAHGAFEWGVIDRLLEDGRVEIKAVTAASAGAMNAVVLAAGLIAGGPAGARVKLDAFWREVNLGGGRNAFGDNSVWTSVFSPDWLKQTPAWRLAQNWASTQSPYEFNPFNINPLRDSLCASVDFTAIRERSPIALYVSATAVRTSESRVFRAAELTCDHIMASACLPHLYQAVEIDGEPYWDGGYLANPALWPLFYDPTPNDILIVNLNPFTRKQTPRSPSEIIDRLNEITFNASLVSELRAVGFVQKLIEEGLLKESASGRYRNMLIHAVEADDWLNDLSMDSKFNTEWSFLVDLKERGRKAADAWLEKGLPSVGVRSSVNLLAPR
ncbi:MAG: patatin-like phospholipase family protein [Caulobacteraceae bacterium]|nr:patatin-like phospholipase family protein [Caulobacteraceae bacterium]